MYLCFDSQGMHESVARVEKKTISTRFFIQLVFAHLVLIVRKLFHSIANKKPA